MTICDYKDRIEVEGGKLVRIVRAVSKKDSEKMLDIYKEYEDGSCVCRNLYYSMYGYRVGFPDEVNSLYHNHGLTFIQRLDEYGECKPIKSFGSRKLTESEKNAIARKYHGFVYVMNKWRGTIENVFPALNLWKEHGEIEFLLAAGFEKIALNKAFWKLTEKKRKEIVMYLRKTGRKDFSLIDIQTILKHKISDDEFSDYKSFCFHYRKVGYELYKYLVKIGRADIMGIMLYRDYHNMLLQTAHDANDVYWKFPKDLQKKHDEIRDEVARLRAFAEAERLKKKQNDYFGAVEKWLGLRLESGGYCVRVPATVEEISYHAEKLHQCLVTGDYISKVIRKECVLVFVTKGSEPVATAQILKGNKIGQFYADELDRSNCLPTEEVREVMNKWIEWKKNSAETKRWTA